MLEVREEKMDEQTSCRILRHILLAEMKVPKETDIVSSKDGDPNDRSINGL